MKTLIATLALLLGTAMSSPTPPLTMQRGNAAFAIATRYAAQYYAIPHCRTLDNRLRYSLKEEGDTIVATIGPKSLPASHVAVTMRASDLAVLRVTRSS